MSYLRVAVDTRHCVDYAEPLSDKRRGTLAAIITHRLDFSPALTCAWSLSYPTEVLSPVRLSSTCTWVRAESCASAQPRQNGEFGRMSRRTPRNDSM